MDPDPANYGSILNDFREILNSYSPKTYLSLFGIGALEDRFLSLMFQDLFIELLPPDIVLRVMDAFLLEGVKILHRYGLAIIRAYKTQIKAGTYTTATNFWLCVKADAANAATKANLFMLFKTLGKDEKLPIADSFVIFSKAKNPAFLESNMINEYPFDEGRSMFSKMLRPMNLNTRRSSFASPLAALNNNSAGSAGVQSGSQKARKSSLTGGGSGATARPSVANMVLNQNPGVNQNQDYGAPLPQAPGASTVLAQRRGSATSANFKRPSGNSGNSGGESAMILTPIAVQQQQGPASFTSPSPTSGARADAGSSPVSALDMASPGSAFSPLRSRGNTQDSAEGGSLDLDAAASAISFSSSFLSAAQARKLLKAINQPAPVRGGYQLAFSTTEHGYSLSSLYSHLSAGCEPCLLLVRLAAPYENVIVGAYVHGPLQPSHSEQSSGNSRTAVFRITESGVHFYPWVGLQRQEGAQEEQQKKDPEEGEGGEVEVARAAAGSRAAARMQFLLATQAHLSFGAAVESGGNALRIDADLHTLHTCASDTFGNPDLLAMAGDSGGSEDGAATHSSASSAQIQEIEVFCGMSAAAKTAKAQSSKNNCLADITNT